MRTDSAAAQAPSGVSLVLAAARPRMLAVALLSVSLLKAQEAVAFDIGPPPTRNMFPMLQAPMVYEPQSPFLVGSGHWRFSIQVVEANVLELSPYVNDFVHWGLSDRRVMSNAFFNTILNNGHWDSNVPFIDYFDEEITRTQFQARTGVGAATDVWVQLNADRHWGGFMDGLAEAAHRMTGSNQLDRRLLARDQTVVAIGGDGNITTYSQGDLPVQVQDPLAGVVHQLARGAHSGLDLMVACKPSLTKAYNQWKSGFDVQGGLGGWWKRGDNTFLYGGAYTHRGKGNAAYQAIQYSGDFGTHLGWQGRNHARVQPFFELYWLSGFAHPPVYTMYHKASLQHDVGFHWFLTSSTAFTFRYVNNITENGNTDDFQLAAGLTWHF